MKDKFNSTIRHEYVRSAVNLAMESIWLSLNIPTRTTCIFTLKFSHTHSHYAVCSASLERKTYHMKLISGSIRKVVYSRRNRLLIIYK